MFHYYDEGLGPKPGLNVYRPGNGSSWGWILRIGNFAWRVRYSYIRKKWFIGLRHYSPVKLREW